MSLTNISSEIGIAEQNSTTQFTTLQTLHNYTTALNTNARQVTIQQLQGKVYIKLDLFKISVMVYI